MRIHSDWLSLNYSLWLLLLGSRIPNTSSGFRYEVTKLERQIQNWKGVVL